MNVDRTHGRLLLAVGAPVVAGAENRTNQWPTEGDNVPFAYEAEPGNFNIVLRE